MSSKLLQRTRDKIHISTKQYLKRTNANLLLLHPPSVFAALLFALVVALAGDPNFPLRHSLSAVAAVVESAI